MKDVSAPADSDARFWNKQELAEWLGVKVRYVEAKVQSGQWPAYVFAELRFSPDQRTQILALHERKAKAKDVNPDLLTVEQAAQKIGVSRAMGYRLVADGELPYVDVSRKGARRTKVRVPAAEVDAWIKRRSAA